MKNQNMLNLQPGTGNPAQPPLQSVNTNPTILFLLILESSQAILQNSGAAQVSLFLFFIFKKRKKEEKKKKERERELSSKGKSRLFKHVLFTQEQAELALKN